MLSLDALIDSYAQTGDPQTLAEILRRVACIACSAGGGPGSTGPSGPTGPAGSGDVQTDLFTPTSGQTVFTLSATPVAGIISVAVNGVDYYTPVSWTVAGTVVTWNDVPFVLQPSDLFAVTYLKAV